MASGPFLPGLEYWRTNFCLLFYTTGTCLAAPLGIAGVCSFWLGRDASFFLRYALAFGCSGSARCYSSKTSAAFLLFIPSCPRVDLGNDRLKVNDLLVAMIPPGVSFFPRLNGGWGCSNVGPQLFSGVVCSCRREIESPLRSIRAQLLVYLLGSFRSFFWDCLGLLLTNEHLSKKRSVGLFPQRLSLNTDQRLDGRSRAAGGLNSLLFAYLAMGRIRHLTA